MYNTKDQSKVYTVVWANLIKKGLHHRQFFLTSAFEKNKTYSYQSEKLSNFLEFSIYYTSWKKVTTKSLADKFNLFQRVNLLSEIYWPKNEKGNILLCLMSPWFQSVRSNNGLLPIALYCLHREQHNEIYLWELHKWSYWFS